MNGGTDCGKSLNKTSQRTWKCKKIGKKTNPLQAFKKKIINSFKQVFCLIEYPDSQQFT